MFYIRPPLGQVPLHILEKVVFTRLEYLKHLQENGMNDFNGSFEYLTENSLHDKIGHFMLRLLSCTSTEMKQYWVNKETLLLRHRLNNISTRQLHRLLRNIIRDLRKLNRNNRIDKDLNKIATFYLQPIVFQHLESKFCTKDCDSFYSQVNFTSVINLVKTREVDLIQGNARVYCSQYKQILESLFNTFIDQEMKHATDCAKLTVATDPRMYSLNEKIHFQLLKTNSQCGRITFENINKESQMFPLCMKHLHSLLRERHRLGHYARFYYSLFLKECGMSIDNSILYWKNEYSKPHACTSSCMHDWQSNEKKFLYSIRHLYGLEGSRKDYKCPGCNVICDETPGAMYEGGCPFKNFDVKKLEGLLETSLGKEKGKLFSQIVPTLKPETACARFFQTVYESEENIVIHSPVQYYLTAVKAV